MLDETIRSYYCTSGDLKITLVVIQLRVTGLEKARVAYLLDECEGRGQKEQCD